MSERLTVHRLSRRKLLASGATLLGSGLLLQACAGAATPTAQPTSQAAAPAPTQPAAKPAAEAKPAAQTPTQPAAKPAAEAKPATAPMATVPRNRTLILGFESGPVAAPDMANPYIPGARINQGIHQAQIESLWYLNYENGKMIPWLAESHQYSADFKQVTVKLRKGVEWSDGKPFTAGDVVFTINLLKDNAPKLGYSADMKKYVAEVRAVDDLTVEFKLTEPYPRFLMDFFAVHIWGAVRILPEHIWKGQDPTTFKNFDLAKGWPVFTGPYRMVKAGQNEFIYDRRDDWWGKKIGFHELPAPQRLIFVDQGPQERRAAMLQNNEVDGLPQIVTGAFQTAMSRNPKVIGWSKNKPWAWVDPCPSRILLNSDKAPWSDPEIRWAVNHALDKGRYVQVTSEGVLGPEWVSRFVFPRYSPLTKYLDENADLFEKYPVKQFNLDKAQAILDKKGYKKGSDGIFVGPDGKRLQAVLVTGSPAEGWVMTGPEFIADNLKRLGIDVSIKQLSGAARQAAVDTGDYDVLPYHNCGGVVDPFKTFDNYHVRWYKPTGEQLVSGQQNTPRWKGAKAEEFGKITDQMGLLEPGDPKIGPLVKQALEIWLSELPNLPLQQQVRIVPYNTTYWTNFPTAENNYIHPPNWWMTTLMIIMNVKPTQ